MYEVNEENFNALVVEKSHSLPVLVDFWASWCGPCQMLMPVLSNLEQTFSGKFILAKVNTDEQTELARANGIRSLPTLKLFVNGGVAEEIAGVQPESVLADILSQYITSESDQKRIEAAALVEQGDIDSAIALLQQTFAGDPDNPRLIEDLVNLYSEIGQLDEAAELMARLTPEQLEKPQLQQLNARIAFQQQAGQGMSLTEIENQALANPGNGELVLQWAQALAAHGQYEQALEKLLGLLNDKNCKDDARQWMIRIFGIIDQTQPEMVSKFRQRMFTALH